MEKKHERILIFDEGKIQKIIIHNTKKSIKYLKKIALPLLLTVQY